MDRKQINQYKVDMDKNQDQNKFISCIVLNEKGQPVRFTRNEKQKLDPKKYDFISGHIKKRGETPMHAMIRELTEETGMKIEEIAEIYHLGTMHTPHELLLDTTSYCYCIITNLLEDELDKRVKSVKNPELENAEILPSMDDLMQNITSDNNWRIMMTKELEHKLNLVKEIIEKRMERKKDRESER